MFVDSKSTQGNQAPLLSYTLQLKKAKQIKKTLISRLGQNQMMSLTLVKHAVECSCVRNPGSQGKNV